MRLANTLITGLGLSAACMGCGNILAPAPATIAPGSTAPALKTNAQGVWNISSVLCGVNVVNLPPQQSESITFTPSTYLTTISTSSCSISFSIPITYTDQAVQYVSGATVTPSCLGGGCNPGSCNTASQTSSGGTWTLVQKDSTHLTLSSSDTYAVEPCTNSGQSGPIIYKLER